METADRFTNKTLPLLRSLIEPFGFALDGPVAHFGPDPKGAGMLRIVVFRSPQARLMVRTRDGATEVLVGPLDAKAGWQDLGWFYPSHADGSALPGIPSGEQLRAIAARLDEEGIAWC